MHKNKVIGVIFLESILITEILITIYFVLIISGAFIYRNYELKKVQKEIEEIEMNSRNYEIILSRLLNKK
ncbi:unknown [Clostridium sp. CAG:1219]|nr:unknown [Clostridium sp. CAG:1219]